MDVVAQTGPGGLSETEARRRLRLHGENALWERPRLSFWAIVRSVLLEPMFSLLIASAVIYLLVGDLAEGLLLCGGALLSIGLVVAQESRSERAMAALAKLAAPTAEVIREGERRHIPARLLVPGDLVILGEGLRVPADIDLVRGDVLSVDESILTGESVAVVKTPSALVLPASDAAMLPGEAAAGSRLFAGTLVTRGQAVGCVADTGRRTQLGKIGARLATIDTEPTPLQKEMSRITGWMASAALLFCIAVAAAYGLLRHDWIAAGLAGLTLAISLIPEEYPMVFSIFMALGAWRLAGHKVLVRKGSAIESLGAVDVLCVDKTGTLTQNRMEVSDLWRAGATWTQGEDVARGVFEPLLLAAARASAPETTDPMDNAVHRIAAFGQDSLGHLTASSPLRPDRLAFLQSWRTTEGTFTTAAKGAPEAIVALCRLDAPAQAAIFDAVEALAGKGTRVLAVASSPSADVDAPGQTFTFEGLVGFSDPVRSEVPAAVADARRAGIRVVMITGDFPATAREISRVAGLDSGRVITGREFEAMSESTRREAVLDCNVFARVQPEQKLEIVRALAAAGFHVAMTGDGVNDGPALKAAAVGVAMGARGTDVAREASDLILLDDRFTSILGGIRLGRRIFDNLRRALTYVTAVHVPVAGLALLPIVLGLPPVLYPLHVMVLELVIDPVCSLAFENEASRADAMLQPPRRANEPLFGRRQLLLGIMQGAVVLAASLGTYLVMTGQRMPEDEARAAAFLVLIVGNLAMAFSNAAGIGTSFFDGRRLAFWIIAGVTALALALMLFVPAIAALFHFAPAPTGVLGALVALGIAAGSWFGLLRRAGLAS